MWRFWYSWSWLQQGEEFEVHNISRLGWVLTSAIVLWSGCGSESVDTAAAVEVGSGSVDCTRLAPFVCERDHGDQCRETSRLSLNLPHRCSTRDTRIYCSSAEECIEGEWFAEDDATGAFMLLRGCTNAPVPGTTAVWEAPTEVIEAASRTCDDVYIEDAACRLFSVRDCPSESGCLVASEYVWDEQRRCFRDEVVEICRRTRIHVDVVLPTCDDHSL